VKGYTNIKADDFCCIGAVIETILIRHNYSNYSKYDIVNEFGFTIPKTAKVSEKINNPKFSDNPNDWGLNLNLTHLIIFSRKIIYV